MKQILLAKRYAKALFELALNEKVTDQVNNDMESIAAVMAENRELRRVMANPLITPQRKISLMKSIFGAQRTAVSMKFVEILIRKGREQQIAEIAEQYRQLYLDHNNIAVVELTTAFDANDQVTQKVAALIHHKSNKTLRFKLKTDPAIIGGYKMKIGDYLLDDSISKVISNLHKEFDKNLYIKRF